MEVLKAPFSMAVWRVRAWLWRALSPGSRRELTTLGTSESPRQVRSRASLRSSGFGLWCPLTGAERPFARAEEPPVPRGLRRRASRTCPRPFSPPGRGTRGAIAVLMKVTARSDETPSAARRRGLSARD